MNRRTFFHRLGAASLLLPTVSAGAESEASARFGLEGIGRISPVSSRSIAESPLSIGFEVLDRKCFDPTKAYAPLGRLGVKWARCQTGWARCEKVKGVYDFAWLDGIVDALLKEGIRPWFNLGYGNTLYTPDAPDEAAVGWTPIFSAEALAAWQRFTQALATHFAARVKHWEVWNEPNITHFWQPQKPNASDYVRLVKETAPLIRQAIPDSVIIGGAYAGIPMAYIEACLDEGLADLVEIISYHPYRAKPEEGYDREITKLRAMIAEKRPGLLLWQGENGCPSKGGPESAGALRTLDWNETRQAKWLLRRILTDLRLRIPLTSYFHTVDLVGYRGKTNFKGLLRGESYTPKPAYFAYQHLCALFDGQTTPAELHPELIDQKKVHLQEGEFARGGYALYAWWMPSDLFTPWKGRNCAIRLKGPEALKIERPVLIDPLDGRIYRLNDFQRSNNAIDFPGLPLLDYPLLLTDQRAAMA